MNAPMASDVPNTNDGLTPMAREPEADGVERRAAVLLAALLLLTVVAAAYLLYARGVFETTQRLVLLADDSEGVSVGMNLTFSGFVIGRVGRIELADDGMARIVVDIPTRDARWLRTSSVFTLTRGLVGNTSIRAYSGVLADPPLPDGAVRTVLAGDTAAEVPRLVAAARELVQHLSALTAADAALAGTLARLQSVAAKLDGPGGAIGVLTGNPRDAAKVAALAEKGRAVMSRIDDVIGHADAKLFGTDGLTADARLAMGQLNLVLGDARNSLAKVDALLQEAQGIAHNARLATTDLGILRAEVEANLRKVENLLNEVHRRWPFARDTEVKLP